MGSESNKEILTHDFGAEILATSSQVMFGYFSSQRVQLRIVVV
jgi:hypothetical protein